MANPVLLFVPLDDRPVTMDMVVDLARAAGVEVRAPDRAVLGDRSRPAEIDRVWDWLDQQVASGGATALIVSVEMLCFGGLVASRKSEVEFEDVAPRLRRLYEIASRVPTYASAVIPRTPVQLTTEDTPEAARGHRTRHLRMNGDLIDAASRGTLRYLLIGQDDTAPQSPSHLERAELEEHVKTIGAGNVLLTSGADELNARLLARWLNDLTGISPSVHVMYTYPEAVHRIPLYEATPLRQTVEEHVQSAGCGLLENGADILLWVHNFIERQGEARDQTDAVDHGTIEARLNVVREAARNDQVAALADVHYANGADRALVDRLLEEPRCAGIVAYAGWNTCSNSLGTALAQAVMVHHLRAFTVPGNDRMYRPAFFHRILDDWGYQSLVRTQLARWLEDRGAQIANLSDHEATAEVLALQGLRGDALPALQASFRHHPIALHRVTFPWHRLFEVRIELESLPTHRGGRRGITVVDYDPRWPDMYKREKDEITGALSGQVSAIEHVGSTSVPGLASKPIVDIMVGVASVERLDQCIEPLRRIGYEYDPDWEISLPSRRYFQKMDSENRHTHHIHIVLRGSDFWERHVHFRDYLRAHPDTARAYGELKKRLAAEHQSGLAYTFAKTEFIRSVETLAGMPSRRHLPAPERRR